MRHAVLRPWMCRALSTQMGLIQLFRLYHPPDGSGITGAFETGVGGNGKPCFLDGDGGYGYVLEGNGLGLSQTDRGCLYFHIKKPIRLAMYSRRRSGFSLIEILLVIGVIAILALAAFLVYPKVRLNYQINDQKQRLEMIAIWASGTYGNRLPANFAGGGSNSPLALSGLAKMNVNNTGFVDVWDARMDVLNMNGELSPSYSRCATAANILFYLNGVPVEACQQLVSQLLRSPDRTCYINVGGSSTIWAPPGAPTLPTPDAIVQACTSNAVSDVVSLRVGISP